MSSKRMRDIAPSIMEDGGHSIFYKRNPVSKVLKAVGLRKRSNSKIQSDVSFKLVLP
eukprot:CAMPEP_0174739068 /NCGR_PEP_ID=MMETSP1094-20130205/71012_1 /TAXON_ID=156173 /ORGANISM="Chrysochromulina brevifilum, Strain UTEX LB 985" /LENGTH=56 /DNA_ID=CAMNT_0015942585 /DNA_START=76 /DNA_END=242 /DNA_ORIENTATION=+